MYCLFVYVNDLALSLSRNLHTIVYFSPTAMFLLFYFNVSDLF